MKKTSLKSNKKGMEVWQLVMIFLAILLLLFLVAWYGSLNSDANSLLERLSNLF